MANSTSIFMGLVHTTPDDPAAPYVVMRSPILDIGSPRALALARECIDECVHKHEDCITFSTSSDPGLPTRVIDCADPTQPRLFSTKGKGGQYLALSYVWGGDQVHKTTMGNISTYERGISFSLLPATIRDAIRVTHALGFRYLWVDSLCIVQDSDEDKRKELSRMHHIYRRAHLTIIAANVDSVRESFLTDRPTTPSFGLHNGALSGDVTLPFICPPRKPTPSTPGDPDHRPEEEPQVGTIYVTAHPERVPPLPHEWPCSNDLGTLGTRAWCMQEYLLSPRALVFSARTLQFRCLTATQHVGNALCGTADEQRLPSALFLEDPPAAAPGSAAWDDMHSVWRDVVGDYTRRAASVAADKLVACAAVMERFGRVLRAGYRAGLWRASLLADMLWVKEGRAYLERPAPPVGGGPRAPSWSWAALDGGVRWPVGRSNTFCEENALVEIVECGVELEDAAFPFGRVKSWILILRATLLPCVLRATGSFGDHDIYLRPLAQARRPQWGADRWGGDGDGGAADIEPKLRGQAEIDCVTNTEIGRMWAIPFLPENHWLKGIVVVLADSDGLGERPANGRMRFRRVGFFSLFLTDFRKNRNLGAGEAGLELTRALKNGEYPMVDIELI